MLLFFYCFSFLTLAPLGPAGPADPASPAVPLEDKDGNKLDRTKKAKK